MSREAAAAGVVLAAGASRRMGRAKALLQLGPQSFIEHLTGALRAGGCAPVMAVVSEPLRERVAGLLDAGVRLVVNPHPERGQISSLRCALDALADDRGLLVVLVDQGCIQAATVAAVRRALARAPLAVARRAGRPGHPTAFGAAIHDRLRGPEADNGARALVEALAATGRVAWVEVDDPGVTRNLNTPNELARARRNWSDGAP